MVEVCCIRIILNLPEAKGLTRFEVAFRHGLGNAIIPLVTISWADARRIDDRIDGYGKYFSLSWYPVTIREVHFNE